ncbi:MAG: polysaccharide deacetylase family protein [Phycisphaerae bacterium]|nr:polysaccharide deacetylase family protein [Phycisphaerae bacterium]
MKKGLIALICVSVFVTGCEMVKPVASRFPVSAEQAAGRVFFLPTFDDGPVAQRFVEAGKPYPRSEDEMLADLYRTLEVLKSRNITAVFYVLYVQHDPDAPAWSPKHSEDAMRRVFTRGIKAISDNGHAIALHCSDHDEYRKLFLARKAAEDDLKRLMAELDRTGVAYYRTWRVPYGGMRTFMNEQQVAKKLSLPLRNWHIDSHDWTTNSDSTNFLKKAYSSDKKWSDNVVKYLQRDVARTKRRKECWRDILFHVSLRTSSHLKQFLDAIEQKAREVYSKPDDPKFTWLSFDDPIRGAVLHDYLNNESTAASASKPSPASR